MNGLEEHLDLMVYEFLRIKALTKDTEIHGLCDRAITNTKQKIPLIEQRYSLQEQVNSLTMRMIQLENLIALANPIGWTNGLYIEDAIQWEKDALELLNQKPNARAKLHRQATLKNGLRLTWRGQLQRLVRRGNDS